MKWNMIPVSSVKGREALFGLYNMKQEDLDFYEVTELTDERKLDLRNCLYSNGIDLLTEECFSGEEIHVNGYLAYLYYLNDTFDVSDYPSFIRLNDNLGTIIDYIGDRLIVGDLLNKFDGSSEVVFVFGDYFLMELEEESGETNAYLLHYTMFFDLLKMDYDGIYMGCHKFNNDYSFRLGDKFSLMLPVEF